MRTNSHYLARRLGIVVVAVIVAAAGQACGGGSSAPTCPADPGSGCLRILFLGNSYTYVNDLPGTFAQLAVAGGRRAETAMVANGGETLDQHASSSDSQSKIAAEHWSYVVLQEQSEIPAFANSREATMYPAARKLVSAIEAVGAKPLFFQTPAHQGGDPDYGLSGYETMQLAIDDGYQQIARELNVGIAPVGYTWFVLLRDHPDISLWQADGSHPSVAGTYLAACVFFAAFFGASPVGLTWLDGLPSAEAAILQSEAAANVLGLEAQWGLR